MDEIQQVHYEAVKDLTVNVLYLSIGVFALVGGFLASAAHTGLNGKKTLLVALAFFGVSVLFGGFVLMHLVGSVIAKRFDPTANLITLLSMGQIICAGAGCVLFFVFLCRNLWR
jgi:uncharacterized membrane protein YqjE